MKSKKNKCLIPNCPACKIARRSGSPIHNPYLPRPVPVLPGQMEFSFLNDSEVKEGKDTDGKDAIDRLLGL